MEGEVNSQTMLFWSSALEVPFRPQAQDRPLPYDAVASAGWRKRQGCSSHLVRPVHVNALQPGAEPTPCEAPILSPRPILAPSPSSEGLKALSRRTASMVKAKATEY